MANHRRHAVDARQPVRTVRTRGGADQPDAAQNPGELRLARDDVVLGAARVHLAAREFGLQRAAPPPLFQCAAGAPLPLHRHGADRRHLQPAHAAARRHHADDRRRHRQRLPALFHVRHRLRPRPLRDHSGGAGRLDAGRSSNPMLFSGDEVQYDDELGLVVAKGHVEINQNDQTLLADTVTYNQRTDTVTASGHVSLLLPTGDVVFADFLELHDDLREGFIRNLRMLLSDRSRLAGNTAPRIQGNRIEIRRGVYSPCEACREDPTRAPIWQIKAEEIGSDTQLHVVGYRDAVMEIDGVPVFYTPYFSHPDPSVKRRSGFLAPSLGNSSSHGFHFSIPYYWVIDQDKYTTFRPMFTTEGGTFLGNEYRHPFSNGHLTPPSHLPLHNHPPT